MTRLWLALGIAGFLPAAASAPPISKPVQLSAQRPVVVELFTSEGCSSCPPADAIVAELAKSRPELLPLAFHVTYWNNLGWTDPFSFEGATQRQRHYVGLSVSPEVYTPAMVVDGHLDVVGSDRRAVEATLAKATADARTAAPVTITRTPAGLEITVGAGDGHGAIVVLGYDRTHQTHVGRGENGGRTLTEANIVRSMATAGSWTGQPLHLNTAMPLGEDVAVIVEADDGHILGAGRLAAPAS